MLLRLFRNAQPSKCHGREFTFARVTTIARRSAPRRETPLQIAADTPPLGGEETRMDSHRGDGF